jgi:hypothetical protein
MKHLDRSVYSNPENKTLPSIGGLSLSIVQSRARGVCRAGRHGIMEGVGREFPVCVCVCQGDTLRGLAVFAAALARRAACAFCAVNLDRVLVFQMLVL